MASKKENKTAAKEPKQKGDFRIVKKRSGRYAVKHRCGSTYISGKKKLEILVQAGLLKDAVLKAYKEPATPKGTAPAEGS